MNTNKNSMTAAKDGGRKPIRKNHQEHDKEQRLRKLADSSFRKDLNPKRREELIRDFIKCPPPDWEKEVEMDELDEQFPLTVLSLAQVREIMAHPADPVFTTKRLEVFQSKLALPDEFTPARLLFVAFRTDRYESPRVSATAVIGFNPLRGGALRPGAPQGRRGLAFADRRCPTGS